MSWISRIFNIKKYFERPLDVLNEVHISESALLKNYDYLSTLQPGVEIFPVLKSNAYGHGIEQVAQILKKRSPSYLVVDSYYEALRIHEIHPAKVLLIGYNLPANYAKMDLDWVTPVITDLEALEVIGKLDKTVSIHVKIDTGMRRQGILFSEVPTFLDMLKKYPKIILEWACTHLADADNSKDDTFSFFQTEHFKKALERISAAGHTLRYVHVANSAGHLKWIGHELANASRVGISLYGINSLAEKDKKHSAGASLLPVMEFTSTIVSKKYLAAWESVSYGLTFKAPWDMEIGIVPVGYYEWLPRSLSEKDFCLTHGDRSLPILGRICMNMCIVDVTNKNMWVGDQVTIFSRETWRPNSIATASEKSGLISYELLVDVAESIRRTVVK